MLRQFRDTVLRKTPKGRDYVQLFYKHSFQITTILYRNPELFSRGKSVMNSMLPDIKISVDGGAININQAQKLEILSLLDAINAEASPALKKSIAQVKKDLRQKNIFRRLGMKNK